GGRVLLAGAWAMAPSFEVAGWFANGPGVFRRIGQVLLEGTSHPARIEAVSVLEDAFEQADPATAALLRSALAAMATDLPAPKQARVAAEGLDPWRECFRVIQAFEIWGIYGGVLQRRRARAGPGAPARAALPPKGA